MHKTPNHRKQRERDKKVKIQIARGLGGSAMHLSVPIRGPWVTSMDWLTRAAPAGTLWALANDG